MAPTRAVGIDLGTTFSVLSYLDKSGHSQVLRDQEGEVLTPSVVLFEHDGVIVGRAAMEARARGAASYRVAEWVKRDMGLPSYSRPIHGDDLPPKSFRPAS